MFLYVFAWWHLHFDKGCRDIPAGVVVGWAHNRDACWYSVFAILIVSLCGLISKATRWQITHKDKYPSFVSTLEANILAPVFKKILANIRPLHKHLHRSNIRAKQKDHPAYTTNQGRWLPVRYVDEMVSQIIPLFSFQVARFTMSILPQICHYGKFRTQLNRCSA